MTGSSLKVCLFYKVDFILPTAAPTSCADSMNILNPAVIIKELQPFGYHAPIRRRLRTSIPQSVGNK